MPACDLIKAKMAERGLRQIDLLDIFKTRGRASEIINGKRAVPKSMAVKLARRLRLPLSELIEKR